MNKKLKIVSTLFIVAMILIISSSVLAYTNPSDFNGSTSNTGNTVKISANKVIGIVQVIGITAAIILLIVLAIKYLTAAPSEKADIKKSAIIYVVGAVLLFATTGILAIIQKFAGEVVT